MGISWIVICVFSYEDSSGYLREEDRYPGYTPAHSAEHDASKKEDVSTIYWAVSYKIYILLELYL